MAGSTGKRYGEEFKLMILEMHKKGKTIREGRDAAKSVHKYLQGTK